MWQRIQTLFLIIAILFNCSVYFMNIATFSFQEVHFEHDMYGLKEEGTSQIGDTVFALAALATLSIILSFAVIINFKKRHLQIKLAQANLLIQLGFIVGIFFSLEKAIEILAAQGVNTIPDYALGSYIAILPLVFIFLAIRAIKKDDALVRAADRIR